MQPAQARRGTSLVAGSSLALGLTLVILALVLTACSGGSSAHATRTSAATPSSSASSTSASPTTTAPPATTAPSSAGATTAPAAPGAGGLPVQPAVPIASPATFTAGVTATVISIEPIDATAALPGEIAGPAVRLTMAVQNGSAAPLDLGNVTVDLQDAAGASATSLSGNGAAPFTGSAQPGGSATGTYVFTLAQNDRTGVRIYVTCNASLPVVVFAGNLS